MSRITKLHSTTNMSNGTRITRTTTIQKSNLFLIIGGDGVAILTRGLEILQVIVLCDRFYDRFHGKDQLTQIKLYHQDVGKFSLFIF